jgi:hypothetical protein
MPLHENKSPPAMPAIIRAAAFLALCVAAAAQFSCAAGTAPIVGVTPSSQANCVCASGTVLKPATNSRRA